MATPRTYLDAGDDTLEPARSAASTRLLALALLVVLADLPASVHAEEGDRWRSAKAAKPARAEMEEAPEQGLHVTVASWAFGIFVAVMSAGMFLVAVVVFADLRDDRHIPPCFVVDFTDLMSERRYKDAYELARGERSMLGRILTAGMARLQYGLDDARKASSEMVQVVAAEKKGTINYLSMVGTLGPAVVAVGPLFGWPFLCGTPLGVALSAAAVVCHRVLNNRLDRLKYYAGTVADDLLTEMYHTSARGRQNSEESRGDAGARHQRPR